MNSLEDKKSVAPSESERAELSSIVNLACEPVSHFWPMKTFIHHNPLHGLEHFPFEKAIKEAERFLRGRGYLPNSEYRKYFQEGRITEESIDEALKDVAQEEKVTFGNQELSQREVLRTILIHGSGEVALDVCSAVLQSSHPQAEIKKIFEKIQAQSNNKDLNEFLIGHAKRDGKDLATQYTLSEWFDQTFEEDVQDQINRQIIKYIGGFLDEGHAPWGMPMREKNLYKVWKELSLEDDSGTILGIKDWKSKVLSMPDKPEDAILERGKFINSNITKWVKETTLLIKKIVKKNNFILIGSSMGAWIALNQFCIFKEQIKGFLGIGPAPEFLENLMWKKFTKKMKKEILKKGIIRIRNGDYEYPISLQLIRDGRKNKILNKIIYNDLKVTMVHGDNDKSVPLSYSKKVLRLFQKAHKKLVIVKKGDHSLSSKKWLKILIKELKLIV